MRELMVGFESALDFWRATRLAAPARADLEPEGRVIGVRLPSLSEQVERGIALCSTSAPLDVVASEASSRLKDKDAVRRVWRGPILDRHLVPLGDGVVVCRPEVMFVQLAANMDEVGLAELAYELAGTYAIDCQAPFGLVTNARPLASVTDLREYARSAMALRVRGATRAVRALDLVVDASNSPRESDVALFLSIPRAKGGAGMSGFRMNVSVELPSSLAREMGQKVIKPDFSWDNGTVGEYDSDQVHLAPDARARDERKRRAFRAMGMDCVTMTNGDFVSNERLNALVNDLERSLGLRRRPPSESILEKRRELRQRLFGPESWGAAFRVLNS